MLRASSFRCGMTEEVEEGEDGVEDALVTAVSYSRVLEVGRLLLVLTAEREKRRGRRQKDEFDGEGGGGGGGYNGGMAVVYPSFSPLMEAFRCMHTSTASTARDHTLVVEMLLAASSPSSWSACAVVDVDAVMVRRGGRRRRGCAAAQQHARDVGSNGNGSVFTDGNVDSNNGSGFSDGTAGHGSAGADAEAGVPSPSEACSVARRRGVTALMVACDKVHFTTNMPVLLHNTLLLLQSGASVNVRDYPPPLSDASARLRGAYVDVDGAGDGGMTPLMVASACGRLDAIQLLLDYGATVIIAENRGAEGPARRDYHQPTPVSTELNNSDALYGARHNGGNGGNADGDGSCRNSNAASGGDGATSRRSPPASSSPSVPSGAVGATYCVVPMTALHLAILKGHAAAAMLLLNSMGEDEARRAVNSIVLAHRASPLVGPSYRQRNGGRTSSSSSGPAEGGDELSPPTPPTTTALIMAIDAAAAADEGGEEEEGILTSGDEDSAADDGAEGAAGAGDGAAGGPATSRVAHRRVTFSRHVIPRLLCYCTPATLNHNHSAPAMMKAMPCCCGHCASRVGGAQNPRPHPSTCCCGGRGEEEEGEVAASNQLCTFASGSGCSDAPARCAIAAAIGGSSSLKRRASCYARALLNYNRRRRAAQQQRSAAAAAGADRNGNAAATSARIGTRRSSSRSGSSASALGGASTMNTVSAAVPSEQHCLGQHCFLSPVARIVRSLLAAGADATGLCCCCSAGPAAAAAAAESIFITACYAGGGDVGLVKLLLGHYAALDGAAGPTCPSAPSSPSAPLYRSARVAGGPPPPRGVVWRQLTATDGDGFTPLMCAVVRGYGPIIAAIIAACEAHDAAEGQQRQQHESHQQYCGGGGGVVMTTHTCGSKDKAHEHHCPAASPASSSSSLLVTVLTAVSFDGTDSIPSLAKAWGPRGCREGGRCDDGDADGEGADDGKAGVYAMLQGVGLRAGIPPALWF